MINEKTIARDKLFKRLDIIIPLLLILFGISFCTIIKNKPYSRVKKILPVDKNNAIVITETDSPNNAIIKINKIYIKRINYDKGVIWKYPFEKKKYYENAAKALYGDAAKKYFVYDGEQISLPIWDDRMKYLTLDYNTGEKLWEADYQRPISPYFDAVSDDKYIYTQEIDFAEKSSIENNDEYKGEDKHFIKAIDIKTGKIKWKSKLPFLIYWVNSPIMTDKYLILFNNNNTKPSFFIDKESGRINSFENYNYCVVAHNKYYYTVNDNNKTAIFSIDLDTLQNKKIAVINDVMFSFEDKRGIFAIYKNSIIYQTQINNDFYLKSFSLDSLKENWQIKLDRDEYTNLLDFLMGGINYSAYEHSTFYSIKKRYLPLIINKYTGSNYSRSFDVVKIYIIDLEDGKVFKKSKEIYEYLDISNEKIFYKNGFYYISAIIPYKADYHSAVLVLNAETGQFTNCFQIFDKDNYPIINSIDGVLDLYPSMIHDRKLLIKDKKLTIIDLDKKKIVYGKSSRVKYIEVLDEVLDFYNLYTVR